LTVGHSRYIDRPRGRPTLPFSTPTTQAQTGTPVYLGPTKSTSGFLLGFLHTALAFPFPFPDSVCFWEAGWNCELGKGC
jgi:hypothetical protein